MSTSHLLRCWTRTPSYSRADRYELNREMRCAGESRESSHCGQIRMYAFRVIRVLYTTLAVNIKILSVKFQYKNMFIIFRVKGVPKKKSIFKSENYLFTRHAKKLRNCSFHPQQPRHFCRTTHHFETAPLLALWARKRASPARTPLQVWGEG